MSPQPPSDPMGLPILNPEEFELEEADDDDEAVEEGPRTILITGASGNIGRKLRAAWDDVYDLILTDRAPDPDEHASWEDLVGPNIDALSNVFHAAALAGVERIVFASSNHVMGHYRDFGDMPITVDLPPRPDGAYGGTKLMGERLGTGLAGIFELTFVALRLGWVQPGANQPDTLPDEWNRSLWLSDRDMVKLMTRAVEADLGDRSSVVVNGMSNNQGMRWDIAVTAELIGYWPDDDAFADETENPGPRSLG